VPAGVSSVSSLGSGIWHPPGNRVSSGYLVYTALAAIYFKDDMTAPKKETLRHEAIRHRDRIDPGSENYDSAITLFFDHIHPAKDQIVGLYWAKGREFNPDGIMERLLREGYQC